MLMKNYLFFILFLISGNLLILEAQVVPNVDWVRNYSERDQLENVPAAIDANNNVYTTGYTVFQGTRDFTTIKYDASGNQQWVQHYNNLPLGDDRSNAVVVDASGFIYVTGQSEGSGTGLDYATVKYDASGVQQWAVRYNGPGNGDDIAVALAVDNNGNVFVTGKSKGSTSQMDYATVKYNSSGVQQWVSRYNGTGGGDDNAVGVALGTGNRVFVTGTSKSSSNSNDIVTVRYNFNNGNQMWVSSINGTSFGTDQANGLIADGNDAVVFGSVENTSTQQDYVLAKLNGNNGNTVFQSSYNGYGSADIATSLAKDTQGDYVLTGTSRNVSTMEYHTLKYNSSGTPQWVNKRPINQAFTQVNPKVATDFVDHIYVCGEIMNSTIDILLYQVTPGGNTTWTETHNGTQNGNDVAVDLVMGNLGVIYLAGQTQNSNAKFDYTTIKYSQTPVVFPPDFNGEEPNNIFAYYKNEGQLLKSNGDKALEIEYYATMMNFTAYVQPTSIHFVRESYDTTEYTPDTVHRVQLNYGDANPLSKIYSFEEVPMYKNFYQAHCPDGITNVKGYNRLMIPNIYPNIDLHYFNSEKGIKYYFVVKPGGNPQMITHNLIGATSTVINGNDLQINTSLGSFNFKQPIAYQINPSLNIVPLGNASWDNIGNDSYRFQLPAYNTVFPLIIMIDEEPLPLMGGGPSPFINLIWSTYYGGEGTTDFKDVHNDDFGNTYITGSITSNTFPIAQGQSFFPAFTAGQEGVVVKIDNQIVPQWVTFIGGANSIDAGTTGEDSPKAITTDALGSRIIICGRTISTDFPIEDNSGAYFSDNVMNSASTNPIADCFVSEFDANGQLVWSTFYGEDQLEYLEDLDLDQLGNLYAVGHRSINTPIVILPGATNYPGTFTSGSYTYAVNGLILKFDNNRDIKWANPFNVDQMLGVHLDRYNSLHITGSTNGNVSTPVLNIDTDPQYAFTGSLFGSLDPFISKFDMNGQLSYSFLYGTNCLDIGVSIASDAIGNIYVQGLSFVGCGPQNYPVTNGFGPTFGYDIFLLKLAQQTGSNPVNILHSTYFGGGGGENDVMPEINSEIVVAPDGHFYFTGCTNSESNILPPVLQAPAAQPSGFYAVEDLNGDYFDRDGYIAAFDGNFNLIWTTYFGGENTDVGTSLSYSRIDDRLYFVGNTLTNNYFLDPSTDDLLPNWEYDPSIGSDDYWQQFPTPYNTWPSWAACFDVANIDIPTQISVNEIDGLEYLIYPNPFTNSITIEGSETITSVKVYDITGKLITTTSPNSMRCIIELDVERGSYVIEVFSDEKKWLTKLNKM